VRQSRAVGITGGRRDGIRPSQSLVMGWRGNWMVTTATTRLRVRVQVAQDSKIVGSVAADFDH
jgi:small-conductance mechanosensitive channel